MGFEKHYLEYLRNLCYFYGLAMSASFKKASYNRIGRKYYGIAKSNLPNAVKRILGEKILLFNPAIFIYEYDFKTVERTFIEFLKMNLRFAINCNRIWYFFSGLVSFFILMFCTFGDFKKVKVKKRKRKCVFKDMI